MSWPPRHPGLTLVLKLNEETVPDFVLLFLPPCGPHLIPFDHRVHQAEPTCLSTPWRPHRIRPFAAALHLHQHKSSRNLHLQYSAKSQSTPRCQSLITPRRDHQPVLKNYQTNQKIIKKLHEAIFVFYCLYKNFVVKTQFNHHFDSKSY
jgi:hypothetical protein